MTRERPQEGFAMLHSTTLAKTVASDQYLMPGAPTTIASRAELEQLLAEDVPYGDLTTDALGIGAARGTMQFTARDAMVLALAEDAAAIIELAGCRVELFVASGSVLEP